MSIYEGLHAVRVRPGAAPIYLHADCQQPLKKYGGLPGRNQQGYFLKCNGCNRIVGEWPTVDEMDLELLAWFEANAV